MTQDEIIQVIEALQNISQSAAIGYGPEQNAENDQLLNFILGHADTARAICVQDLIPNDVLTETKS